MTEFFGLVCPVLVRTAAKPILAIRTATRALMKSFSCSLSFKNWLVAAKIADSQTGELNP
jgi:hypothetical protein